MLKDPELSFPTLFQFFPMVPLKRILQERHRDDQTAGLKCVHLSWVFHQTGTFSFLLA
ncbi:hypothetical protein Nmel_007411 [Mimus melanotis]